MKQTLSESIPLREIWTSIHNVLQSKAVCTWCPRRPLCVLKIMVHGPKFFGIFMPRHSLLKTLVCVILPTDKPTNWGQKYNIVGGY